MTSRHGNGAGDCDQEADDECFDVDSFRALPWLRLTDVKNVWVYYNMFYIKSKYIKSAHPKMCARHFAYFWGTWAAETDTGFASGICGAMGV